jgi:S-methylmethionine-dependent homocysteine/selenocysteine methylase
MLVIMAMVVAAAAIRPVLVMAQKGRDLHTNFWISFTVDESRIRRACFLLRRLAV